MRHTPMLVSLLAASLAAGCGTTAPVQREIVWPDPPEKPRIRFVTSFHSVVDLESGGWSSFTKSLFGSQPKVRMMHPMGLALSPDGQKLYIADLRGSRLLVADFAAKTLRHCADNRAWQHPGLGLAVDSKGNVFVSDARARRVSLLAPDGTLVRSFGGELERPTGLALDEGGGHDRATLASGRSD